MNTDSVYWREYDDNPLPCSDYHPDQRYRIYYRERNPEWDKWSGESRWYGWRQVNGDFGFVYGWYRELLMSDRDNYNFIFCECEDDTEGYDTDGDDTDGYDISDDYTEKEYNNYSKVKRIIGSVRIPAKDTWRFNLMMHVTPTEIVLDDINKVDPKEPICPQF